MATQQQTPRNEQEFEQLFRELSNWGRWGADDQRGALNLITPETVRRAAGLVREGATINISHQLPTVVDVENFRPVIHFMVRAGDMSGEFQSTLDFIAIQPHGYAISHIDALCHFHWRGQMYNGHPVSLVTSIGARADSIDAAENGIIGRGVLLDIARLRGVDYLDVGEAILPAELDAAERAAGLRVGPGDILLVRTGRAVRKAKHGPSDPLQGLAGLHASCARWIRERDAAVVGCDGITDVRPSGVDGVEQPMHLLLLVGMGVHLLDNMQLEGLAEACAARTRWEFLLTLNPLRLKGGTGSPLNPIAVF